MSDEAIKWFDGFAKTAEAAGVTDPAEIHKLIVFHKRAELAAKHPEQFEAGYTAVTKKAQTEGLYNSPMGQVSQDITPDPTHHAVNYGIGGGFAGATAGGILGKLMGTAGKAPLQIAGGKGILGTLGQTAKGMLTHPTGSRWGILATILGAMYGASKGKFMQGRYGQGSQVGMTPESYLNRMDPEIQRMKDMKSRLSGTFGSAGNRNGQAWYNYTNPQ